MGATEQTLEKTSTKPPKQKAKVPAGDVLLGTAHDLENLDQASAYKLADELIEASGFTDFRLGGVLSVIQSNNWYEGYESFRVMIEQKYGLHYRKAMYLIEIYNTLVQNQIPWEKVKDLGWTKLNELIKVLTAENVDEWVVKAKALTVLQLREAIKTATSNGAGGNEANAGDSGVTSAVSTMTFKLHQDQRETVRAALDKGKAEASTEFDTVALENICMAYLGNAVTMDVQQMSLTDKLKGHELGEILEVLGVQFPSADITVAV